MDRRALPVRLASLDSPASTETQGLQGSLAATAYQDRKVPLARLAFLAQLVLLVRRVAWARLDCKACLDRLELSDQRAPPARLECQARPEQRATRASTERPALLEALD